MDLKIHFKHRTGVIRPPKYSSVANIALFHVVSGEKAQSIYSRITSYKSYRAIGLSKGSELLV
jgi:hypothetical protein